MKEKRQLKSSAKHLSNMLGEDRQDTMVIEEVNLGFLVSQVSSKKSNM